jgi:hypothetical protein
MPGFAITKEYSQIRSISLSRFSYVEFHFDNPKDDFSIRHISLKVVLDALYDHGVTTDNIKGFRLRLAALVLILPTLLLFIAASLLGILVFNDKSLTSGDVFRLTAYPLGFMIGSMVHIHRPGSNTEEPDDDDW